MKGVDLDPLELEVHLRVDLVREPRLKRFVALLGRRRIKRGADDPVSGVFHAPDQVAEVMPDDSDRVRQCRDPFPDHRRISVVNLELKPLRLR